MSNYNLNNYPISVKLFILFHTKLEKRKDWCARNGGYIPTKAGVWAATGSSRLSHVRKCLHAFIIAASCVNAHALLAPPKAPTTYAIF